MANNLWIIICSIVMFILQGGFTCYESGLVQSKNVISVAIENIFNLSINILVFSLIGYGIMYSAIPFKTEDFTFFFGQIMYACTSGTIFAAAMSERTKLYSLIVAAALYSAFIYPVIGRLVWGDMFGGTESILNQIGFIDIAGASVVHLSASCVAIAGMSIVGKRKDAITRPSNYPLSVLGVMILWFGWFGFNGASISVDDPRLPFAFINTILSGAAGTIGAAFVNKYFNMQNSYMLSCFDGALSGLVAITAVGAYCDPWSAGSIGLIAGILSHIVATQMDKTSLDDVVHVIPIHFVGSIVGLLSLPAFIIDDKLLASTRLMQAFAQGTGVIVCIVWCFGSAYLMFIVLDKILGLRVSPEEEEKGLNIVEFDDIYTWESYLQKTSYERQIEKKNDLLMKQSELLAQTEKKEREKLARDLHDGVGQTLSAMKVILGMGQMQARSGKADAFIDTAIKAAELADTSTKEMRNVLNNLRPEILNQKGLKAGIRSLIANISSIDNLNCILDIEDPLPEFTETVELNIYRLIQECLTNIVKHANASHVIVQCTNGSTPGFYRFVVSDDGDGFDYNGENLGVGIPSMRDRVAMLNGHFEFNSSAGNGTVVIMEVPTNESITIE